MGMTGKSPPSSSPTSSGTNTFLGRFPGFDGGSGSSSGSRKQQECENPSTLKKSGSLEDIMKVSREFGDLQSLEDFGIKSEQEEQSHLAELRQVVSLQDDIECPDDDFLILCLRVWQYSVKDAARVASNFARFRSKHGWGYRISAASVEKELQSGVHWLLPGRDKLGRGILVYNAAKIGHALSNGSSVESLQKMGAYLIEMAVTRSGIPKQGIIAVIDARNVGLDLLLNFSLGDMRRGVLMWKDAFPCKIKKIYIVGMSFAFQAIFALLSGLLGKKIRERIVLVGSSLRELHEDLEHTDLPQQLGGGMVFDWSECLKTLQDSQSEIQVVKLGEARQRF